MLFINLRHPSVIHSTGFFGFVAYFSGELTSCCCQLSTTVWRTLFVPWLNLLEILLKFGYWFNIRAVKTERPGCCKLVLIQTDNSELEQHRWNKETRPYLQRLSGKSMQHPHQQNHVFIRSMETPKEKKKRFLCKSPDSNNDEISDKTSVKSNIHYRDISESSFKFLLFISSKTIFFQKNYPVNWYSKRHYSTIF